MTSATTQASQRRGAGSDAEGRGFGLIIFAAVLLLMPASST